MAETNHQPWWGDPRNHFGVLQPDDSFLVQRESIQPAIEFICAGLNLPAGAKILDLCCGPGRYAVELAQRGFAVMGIDFNEDYIALAKHLAEREAVHAEFLIGDMREIPYVGHFDAIINVGTSFGFFDDEADNQQVIQAVARALKPGGVFLLEMGNRDHRLKYFLAKEWQKREDGAIMIIQREFDYLRSRINTSFELLHNGKPSEKWSHTWRAYALVEIAAMLKQAGLVLSDVFGDWKRRQYSVDCSRMVVVSRK